MRERSDGGGWGGEDREGVCAVCVCVCVGEGHNVPITLVVHVVNKAGRESKKMRRERERIRYFSPIMNLHVLFVLHQS